MSTLPAFLNGQRARGWARSSLFWILPAVALALVVGWEIDWGRQIVHVPGASPAVDPAALTTTVLPDYQIDGGLPAHGETVARTLFNATRRPAPVLAGDGGPRRMTSGQYVLVGTAVTGDHNVAFLKEAAGGKSRVVRQGDEINGMRVAMVGPDRVTFALGDEAEELVLKVAPGPKTTVAAAPPPRRNHRTRRGRRGGPRVRLRHGVIKGVIRGVIKAVTRTCRPAATPRPRRHTGGADEPAAEQHRLTLRRPSKPRPKRRGEDE